MYIEDVYHARKSEWLWIHTQPGEVPGQSGAQTYAHKTNAHKTNAHKTNAHKTNAHNTNGKRDTCSQLFFIIFIYEENSIAHSIACHIINIT